MGLCFCGIFICHMKKSELKTIVTEIIRRTFWEMNQSDDELTWKVDGTTVTIENISLPNGQKVWATVEVPFSPTVQDWTITGVWEIGTNSSIPLTPELAEYIDSEMSSIVEKLPPPAP